MEIKLSQTSKMPCQAWSIPAIIGCNRGCQLAKLANSVCSGCYATKGSYRFPIVKTAREINMLNYISNPNLWAEHMIAILHNKKLFRWFDSGDILTIEMLEKIVEIAIKIPTCEFWLPTREIDIIKKWITENKIPDNLNIRISADFIGIGSLLKLRDEFKKISSNSFELTFSGVDSNDGLYNPDNLCLATWEHEETDGKCGNCKKCWDKSQEFVIYKKH